MISSAVWYSRSAARPPHRHRLLARRIVRRASLLVALLVAGCSAPEAARSSAAAIFNGSEDDEHPAVLLLRFSKDGGLSQSGACTAFLVGQRTLLTAAHCLGFPRTDVLEPEQQQVLELESATAHPQFKTGTPYINDIAVVRLKAAPWPQPMTLWTEAPQVGSKVWLVGFGETSKGAKDNNVKRVATNTLAELRELYSVIGPASSSTGAACYGDSGGPLLAEHAGEQLVLGLLSYITGPCGSTTYATRLDVHLPWLKATAQGDLSLFPPDISADTGISSDMFSEAGPDSRADGGPPDLPKRPSDGCSQAPPMGGGNDLLVSGLLLLGLALWRRGRE